MAVIAGGAVRGYDPHAWLPALLDPWAHLDDLTRELVPEWRGHMLHDGGMAAAIGLQVGPACQGTMDTDEHLARTHCGYGNVLNPHITRSIEDCRLHEVTLLPLLIVARARATWSLDRVQGASRLGRKAWPLLRNALHNGYDTAHLFPLLDAS